MTQADLFSVHDKIRSDQRTEKTGLAHEPKEKNIPRLRDPHFSGTTTYWVDATRQHENMQYSHIFPCPTGACLAGALAKVGQRKFLPNHEKFLARISSCPPDGPAKADQRNFCTISQEFWREDLFCPCTQIRGTCCDRAKFARATETMKTAFAPAI